MSDGIRDGRYHGANDQIFVDLRVDAGVCGVISADVFRRDEERRDYVASFRTLTGQAVDARAGSWLIVGEDELGQTPTGRLTLGVGDAQAQRLVGNLFLDGALQGLPSRTGIPFVAERVSDALRTVGIEMEVEQGVEPPGPFDFNGRNITIERALNDAGFETKTAGGESPIPRMPEGGWQEGHLHTLMSDHAQATLARREWELHLLILSRAGKPGVLGAMFDKTEPLPRQGAAVFAGAIRGIQGIDHARKLIQTTVHELGHGLNLAHRFERVVGRSNSLSFMNYDWRYRGGGRVEEFWGDFTFTFDDDELEFLRHAPLPRLIPGGAPFHSARYWLQGNGGYSPYLREVANPDLGLSLQAPTTGPVFAFAEPVFLVVSLQNRTGEPMNLPRFFLDPKAGFLDVLIKRRTLGTEPGPAGALSFLPVVQRCFDFGAADSDAVPPQGTMSESLNLTFGSGGFAFAEPGTYDVTAVLVMPDKPNAREFIVQSNTIQIRISTPKTVEDERDALDLFRHDVGLFIALGGSGALDTASDVLNTVVDRRQARDRRDPVVGGLIRAQALHLARDYVRFRAGKYERQRARYKEAADRFNRLEQGVGDQVFDDSTMAGTRALAERCRKAADLPLRGA